jgi:hypothetical protein
VEVHSAASARGIVERLSQGREIGNAPRMRIQCRRCAGGSEVGYDRNVPVEQAFTLISVRPKQRGQIRPPLAD